MSLVDYSSSDSDDHNNDATDSLSIHRAIKRRKTEGSSIAAKQPSETTTATSETACSTLLQTTKLPKGKQNIGKVTRVRSTPHVEGNWATYVYCSFRPPSNFLDLISRLILRVQESVSNTQPIDLLDGGFHISLSRTVFLKVFQIDRFVHLMAQRMLHHERFSVGFTRISHYVNDDKTRSFVGFDIGFGHEELASCLKDVDDVIGQFRKDPFYETPSFHASVAWALGATIDNSIIGTLSSFESELRCFRFPVNSISCRIGNKKYDWDLGS